MNIADIILSGFILGVAGTVFYLAVWKRKGLCLGCSSQGSCQKQCSNPTPEKMRN